MTEPQAVDVVELGQKLLRLWRNTDASPVELEEVARQVARLASEREAALRECSRLREERDEAELRAGEAAERAYNAAAAEELARNAEREYAKRDTKAMVRLRRLRAERRYYLQLTVSLRADVENLAHRLLRCECYGAAREVQSHE